MTKIQAETFIGVSYKIIQQNNQFLVFQFSFTFVFENKKNFFPLNSMEAEASAYLC